MHPEVRTFIKRVKKAHPKYFRFKEVLEVGSLNVNGSVRKHFWFCPYLGIDLSEGRGVDHVCAIKDLHHPNSYDVVISTEMLEHDRDWKESLMRMYSNLRNGGLLVITCASTMRPEHGTTRTTPQDSPFTTDYYQNISIADFSSVLPPELFSEYLIGEERSGEDLMFYGIKESAKTISSIGNRYKGEFVKSAI